MERWKSKLRELFGIDVRSLACFRIGLALILIGDLLNRVHDLAAHYTDEGVLPRDVLISHFLDPWHFSLHLINGSREVQFLLFALAFFFAVAMLAGYYTRLSTAVSWMLLISLHTRNPLLIHGGDVLLRMLLFWGMFLPLGACWSLDHWLAKKRQFPIQVVSVATCALLLQVCMMYWFTALFKTDGVWRDEGTAVWYAFSNEFFATEHVRFLLDYPILLQVLTFCTLFLEAIGPFIIFLPFWTVSVRIVMVTVFIGFHLILGATLELGIFPYVSVVAWVPFFPGQFWDWLIPFKQESAQPIRPSAIRNGVNGIAALFFAYVILWNLRSVGVISLPSEFNAVASLMRIDQHWNMFAPFPLREDGWFVIPATLRNGQEVDLYTNRTLNWKKPILCSACFKNDRWRSYMLNLIFDSQNDINLANYAGYLWENWDETHPYEERLLGLEIIWMSKENSIEEPPPKYHEKVVLWKNGGV